MASAKVGRPDRLTILTMLNMLTRAHLRSLIARLSLMDVARFRRWLKFMFCNPQAN